MSNVLLFIATCSIFYLSDKFSFSLDEGLVFFLQVPNEAGGRTKFLFKFEFMGSISFDFLLLDDGTHTKNEKKS
jgi:hypothetical protein